ncbi:MAG: phosphatidylserine decarboxylase [Candidatus Omnitrophica bacterium]|nr:phosphatidylserine decarboxylase [Candidatus Omnitrophota bacterium]
MMKITSKIPLDRRVWPGVIFLGVLMILERIWHVPYVALALLILLVAHFLFFRDPHREAPREQGLLSPADGTVVKIDEVFEDRFLHEQAVRIRIFRSVFDVHTTRAPLAGIVKYQNYVKGKFLNALRKDAFDHNESNWIGIENRARRVLVRQLTGAIARRIYSDVAVGQVVGRGEKIGMICYGSGVEISIPKRMFRASVRIGQHVAGGATVLGAWNDEG